MRPTSPSAMLYDVEYVWIAVTVIVMGGMWWVAYRMEPHWSSRDGMRFLCGAQELVDGNTVGHPRETRVVVTPDGALFVTQKHMMRRRSSSWVLIGKSPDPPRKVQVYVAQHHTDGHNIPSLLALRIPNKSRCVAVLDEVLANAQLRASRRAPGNAAPAGQPDPD